MHKVLASKRQVVERAVTPPPLPPVSLPQLPNLAFEFERALECSGHLDKKVQDEVDIKGQELINKYSHNESDENEKSDSFSFNVEYLDPESAEDEQWRKRTGLDDDGLSGALETIIFMSDKPISVKKMQKLIDDGIPLNVIESKLIALQQEYESSRHGIRLMEVAEGYQFRTKSLYSKYVHNLFRVHSLVLSPTALEVLALIAYKQPLSKVEIDKTRGVDSSHIVRGLIEKKLVRVRGRSNELGRPVQYGTTAEFLEVFNLPHISALPAESELEATIENNIGRISDIKGLCTDGDKTRFVFDELEEIDQLSESIKSISPDTPFTKSLKVEEKRRVDGDGNEIRSAFDLLEEYVSVKMVTEENKNALISELFQAASVKPSIVSDLRVGPNERVSDVAFELPDLPQVDKEEDELYGHDDKDLEQEIDEAFASLEKSQLGDSFEDASDEVIEEVMDKSEQLDSVTNEMIQKGDELGIDLNFFSEENTRNSEVESNLLQ